LKYDLLLSRAHNATHGHMCKQHVQGCRNNSFPCGVLAPDTNKTWLSVLSAKQWWQSILKATFYSTVG